MCDACQKFVVEDFEARRAAKARVVTYAAYEHEEVYDPHRSKFYRSLDELYDDYYDDPAPRSVYGIHVTKITLDASDILRIFFENLEDDTLVGEAVDSLQPVLDRWCEEINKTLRTYEPDFTTRILLPEKEHADE